MIPTLALDTAPAAFDSTNFLKGGVSAFIVLAVLAALASLAAAQSFGDFFPGFAAAQSSGAGTGGGRSNTGNPGPILFPNTPPGSETSGVVVGASGFGFVPPGGRTGGARGNTAAFTGSFGSEDYP